jgi:predicted flap endonuclease-1-like 5' DNA nuclease
VTRVVAPATAAEQERIAAEAKAAERARVAAAAKAAEEASLAVEAKAAELARITGAAKAAQDARRAAEAKAAAEARVAAAAKAGEDARLAVEAKAAELTRIATAAKAAQGARVVADVKGAENTRIAAGAKAAEDARVAAEAKTIEEARIAAAAKATEDARLAVEARIAEAAREAASKVANDPGVAATAAAAEVGPSHPGSKPAGIAAPAEGEADDLTWIKGIGPRNEKACNALGIYQFRQIADWTPDEAIWVGHHLAFPGRIERERWIGQARLLAAGGETEHAKAVKSGSLAVDDTADEPLDEASAEMLAKSLPEQAASVEGEDKHAGRRPHGLAGALGQPDDLKKIRGIGPQNERRLHGLGIWHFWQIATWSEDNVKWVGSYLAFAGRIDREKWIAQARDLAAGRDTEFSRRVAAGKVATSKDDGANG